MRAGIVCGVLCLSLAAQAPAPVEKPEPEPVATAAESLAFAEARELAEAWAKGRGDTLLVEQVVHRHLTIPGYELVRVDFDGEEPSSTALSTADPRRFFRPGACIVSFVPSKDGPECHRIFAVRGDGAFAWTENEQGLSLHGEREFRDDGIFGEGAKVDVRSFPRTPSSGRDGNLWMPASMLAQRTFHIMMVDEHGAPLGMHDVRCMPAEEDYVVDAPLVAGRVRTMFEGDAKLTGLPAARLGFVVDAFGLEAWLAPENVKVSGRSVRLVITSAVFEEKRILANELAAIATLKNISSAQAQCQACGVIDGNQNGQGEFGTFGELSGSLRVRGSDETITPPVLSAAFGKIEGGVVERSGYRFRMFLPDKDGVGVPENDKGGGDGTTMDPGKAEQMWCCYAWPIEAGESGRRVFFINQAGDVLAATNDAGYSGRAKVPGVVAAYVDKDGMASGVAANRAGADGQSWQVVW